MLDSDFNLNQNKEFSKTISTPAKKGEPSYWDKELYDAFMQKIDIPFEQQAEKKMQVHEAARRLELPAFIEWMYDKHYFIGKL